MGDYQLRKDIDRFKAFLDDLEDTLLKNKCGSLADIFDKYYDQSEVDVATGKLQDDLMTLDTDLSSLYDNLIDFNQSLLTFNGDTTTLASDLTKLKDNLNSVLSDIGTLQTNLTTVSNGLTSVTGQVNTLSGDVTSLGTTLNTVSGNLTTLQGQVSTLSNGLDSLEATVDALDSTSGNLSQSTQELFNQLTTLMTTLDVFNTYLTDFEGDLTDLEDELADNNIDSSSLNTDLLKLVAMIGQVKSEVTDVTTTVGDNSSGLVKDLNDVQTVIGDNSSGLVKDMNTAKSNISSVQTTIGDNSSGLVKDINTAKSNISSVQGDISTLTTTVGDNSSGLVKDINTAQSTISSLTTTIGDNNNGLIKDINTAKSDITTAQGDVTTIQKQMYKGNSGTGTTISPATGTVMGNIKTVQSDITTVQGDISDVQDGLSDAEDNIDVVDTVIAKLLNPSYVLVNVLISNETPSQQTLLTLQEDYGFKTDINYWYIYDSDIFYRKTSNGWGVTTFEDIPSPKIAICIENYSSILPEDNTAITDWKADGFDYYYEVYSKSYFENTHETIEGVLGGYGRYRKLDTAPDFFIHTQLYDAIDDYFSLKTHTHSNYANSSHTHSYSSLTNTNHTHSSNDITGLTANKNVVTNSNGKLTTENKPTIPTKTSDLTNDGTGTSGVVYVLSNDSRLSDSRTPTSHTHDDRYYTMSDVNTALNGKVDSEWTSLYNYTYGTIKTDGHIISCLIKSPSVEISNNSWTTMATFSNLGVSTNYAPLLDIYQPYMNGITMRLTTDGLLQANRPSGKLTTDVKFYALYAR